MFVTFWGVRGSIPTPLSPRAVETKVMEIAQKILQDGITDPSEVAPYLREKYPLMKRGTVGGNTTCISVEWPGSTVIFDAGTGIIPFGKRLMFGASGKGEAELHILQTHTHWDHIMGFPYFAPLFKQNIINIHGVHPNLEARYRGQQQPQYYPVSLDIFPATVKFHQIEEGVIYNLEGGGTFKAMRLHHPGDCYGYRVARDGVSIVMATDSEYKNNDNRLLERAVEFFHDADLLVFDSQYTLEEALVKEDWGHSTAIMGVKLAVEAGVKRLALFHHEPNYSDDFITDILNKAKAYKNDNYPEADLEIFAAVEGETINLK
ncbi:MBL fold metallo-hydrolase [Calditrichota bacterium]